jgi:hypothetical protein
VRLIISGIHFQSPRFIGKLEDLTGTSNIELIQNVVIVEFQLDEDLDYRSFVNENNWYPAKLLGFYHLLPNAGEDLIQFQVLAHCVQYQRLDSEIYSRRSLLQCFWLYEVTAGLLSDSLYRTLGSVKSNTCVRGLIFFVIKESPGFHKCYHDAEDKRIWVISDTRKEWPHICINDPMSNGCNVSDGANSDSDG